MCVGLRGYNVVVMGDGIVMCVGSRIVYVGRLKRFLSCWGYAVVTHAIVVKLEKGVLCLCDVL